jgi:NAD(P)-dependent dehydrogenase (short-subunit alcohol dehydrogenase family)
LLFRLSSRPRSGASDAAPGQRQYLLHRCDGKPAWGSGYAAFASAKFGLRAVAQATARELGPKNIHVAHLIIDSGVDTEWVRQRRIEALGPGALDNPDLLMPPSSVAESYWLLYQQPRTAWTFELEIRPFGEKW